jgi:hypothetical protein
MPRGLPYNVKQCLEKSRDSALPIQFVAYDKLSDDEKRDVNRIVAMVKIQEKPVTNSNLILPGEVVKQVQQALGNPRTTRLGKSINKFNTDTHTRCWKKYQVRPNSQDKNPHNTNATYCIYDKLTGHYGYTQEWVSFLTIKMQDENEYNSLFK